MTSDVELRDSSMFGNGWLWPAHDTACWNFFNSVPTSAISNTPATFPLEIIKNVVGRRNVIQAGGNSGLYAKLYSQHFDTVYTFEPDNLWFRCLTHNAKQENIFKFQCCLGNSTSSLSVSPPDWDIENLGAIHVSGSGNIPQVTIDSLNVSPDLIHLDIEGFELFALQGAKNTISTHKPVIVLEMNNLLCQHYGYTTNDIDTYLSQFGYTRKIVWTEDAPYGTQDIMFTVENRNE